MSEERQPTTMAQATNNEQPASPAVGASEGVVSPSRRKLLPFAWPLFTAVWLLFPIGFVIQVLRTDLSPVQMISFLVSIVAFDAIFL